MDKYKVVFNRSYGGFGISVLARELLKERGLNVDSYCLSIPRHHPELVAIVEALGEKAHGEYAELAIATVSGPYIIDEYDGLERVLQKEDIRWIDPSDNGMQSPWKSGKVKI